MQAARSNEKDPERAAVQQGRQPNNAEIFEHGLWRHVGQQGRLPCRRREVRTGRTGREGLRPTPEDPFLNGAAETVIRELYGTTTREQGLVAEAKAFGSCMGHGTFGSEQNRA